MRALRFYLHSLRLAVKLTAQNRVDFAIGFVSTLLVQAVAALFITVVFSRISSVSGWSLDEVLLVYGLTTTCRDLSATFFNMPWDIGMHLKSARFDTFRVRPLPVLLQTISHSAYGITSIGQALFGLCVLSYALRQTGVALTPGTLLYLAAILVSGTATFFAINLTVASLSFWVRESRSLMYPIFWLSDFVRFPLEILPGAWKFLLTWILPYAATGYYPARYLLHGDAYSASGLASLLAGAAAVGVMACVWHAAQNRYEGTGS